MTDSVTSELLSALCHELRGPLGALGNWVHVLSVPEADAATRARALSGLKDDVRSMGAALDLVSAFASATSEPKPPMTPIDVDSLLRGLAETMPVDKRAVVSISEPALRVLGDPARLRELLGLFLRDSPPASPVVASRERESVVFVVTLDRSPRPLPLILARALTEQQGGELMVEATEKETFLRLRMRRAS